MGSQSCFGRVLGILVLVGVGAAGPAGAELCGDADGRGTVGVTDGVQVLRAVAGLSSTCTLPVCDVDDSGSISVTDGVNVLRVAAGLVGTLSCASAPKAACREAVRAGNLTSAAALCASAATDAPGDAEARGLAAGAGAVSAAFTVPQLMNLSAAFGFERSGSAADICGAAFRRLDVIPPGTPTTGAVQATLRQQGLALIDAALVPLGDVSESVGFGFDLGNLPSCAALSGRPRVDVDFGDVLLARFALHLLAAGLHATAAYNVDFNQRSLLDDGTARDVFTSNPSLFTRLGASSAAAEIGLSRSRLDAALSAFAAAVAFIDGESDDQSNDLFIILPSDRARMLRRREAALRLQVALRGTATFEASIFGLVADQRLSLEDLFDGEVGTLRPFVPGFTGSGKPDLCQVSDPTFGGHAPDMTRTELARLLDLDCQ